MNHEIFVGLAAVILLGITAQWLAWRLRLPSILVLLVFGFLAGPVTGFLHPDRLMGDLLLPVVSLSVALILFEGGLTLRLRDLRSIGAGLMGLVTGGVLLTWGMTSIAARLILGFDPPLAVLTGAILVVTGPTVVLPLLRHVKPRGRGALLVKWEGILNDPVGAVLAVVVFQAIATGTWEAGSTALATGLLKSLMSGVLLGVAGAAVMVLLMRFYHVPDYLENPVTLMMVVAVYAASDFVQSESGLASVTIMGIALANQRVVHVGHIVKFKEDLRVLLISVLFILLAARLDLASLEHLGWHSAVFLVLLILVIRPLSVFGSAFGSGLGWRDKVFISWMAPRGIVAAAVSSVFAFRLEEAGFAHSDELVPLVFLVIVGTVLVYGLSAGWVARRLGLSGGAPDGCLLIGAHRWARELAEALDHEGIPVLLVDNNRGNVSAARMAGLETVQGNALSESLPEELNLERIGKLLALTANDEVNALAALHFTDVFGRREVYQLADPDEKIGPIRDDAVSRGLRGRVLFGEEQSYPALSRRFAEGAVVKATPLSAEFDFAAFRERYGDSAIVLFLVSPSQLQVAVAGEELKPRAGQTVIALVDEPKES